MADDAVTPPAPVAAHDTPPQTSAPRLSTAVIVLAVIVAVEAVVIVLLAAATAFLWGQMQMWGGPDMMYGMPSPEEEQLWMAAEDMAVEVGYLIAEDDLESYLDLYDTNDPHVDFAAVEADFAEVAQKAAEADGNVEYMSDMMPATYEDEATGETIVKATISGMDYNTGAMVGGRLTVYALVGDGETTLTGKEGRDLSATSSMY